jgi:phosphate transport system substrate-binding protein
MQGYVKNLAKEFGQRNPEVSVVAEAGGSTAGIVALKRGAIDVAAMSRDLTLDEDEPYVRNFLLARDGIAIVVSTMNPIDDLSSTDAKRIFLGQARMWNAVGGDDGPIHVITREADQLTRHSIREMVLGGEDIFGGAHTIGSWDDMIKGVKEDPHSIGFLSLRHVTPDVKTLRIDGVAMTRATMLSGRYPLSRSFYLVVRNPSTTTERFIDFAIGEHGQQSLEKDGLIPVY